MVRGEIVFYAQMIPSLFVKLPGSATAWRYFDGNQRAVSITPFLLRNSADTLSRLS